VADQYDRLKAALSDRYAIERELGSGGMATVYLAEDLKHHRMVAVKVLRPELAAALGPDRFLREIEIAASLTHPHILPLYDSGEAEGFLYYVMPYVEGESLRDRLNREKQLPVDDALQIAREVADALGSAHKHDVIHRDIKPENILLEEGHAVVADFGIARAVDVAGGTKLTETGIALGTPEYMSPEQAAGGRDLDGRSDIYGLGCVLYEMLGGQPPFTGVTVESIVNQHMTAEPAPVTQARPTVRAEVADTLNRMLGKAPADRYTTCAQLAEALTPSAVAAGREATPRMPVRRLAIYGAAAVVVVVGTLWFFSGAFGPGTPDTEAEPPRIVVLPSPEDEFFADGMTEEITSRLGQVGGLGVIGRTSAMQYKGAGKPIRTIGVELEVDYALEGTVRWSVGGGESRVRITPQLIRVSDETHVWTERYDAVLADIFAVQGQIASKVVAALGSALGEGVTLAEAALPTENLEAYEQYLRGNALFGRCGGPICPTVREAVQHYEQTVRLDPAFAQAWARLAMARRWVEYGRIAGPGAKNAAARALALNPDLPDAHLAAGLLYYTGPEQDHSRAEEAFRRALKLQPDYTEALRWLGMVLRRRGETQAAAAVLQRHADLDPRHVMAQLDAGATLMRLRRYEEAEQYLERNVALGGSGHDWLTVAARRIAERRTGGCGFNNANGFLALDTFIRPDCRRRAAAELARAVPVRVTDSIYPWHAYTGAGR
jgi:serine/threonine-protein kinase